jgi:hypothetical protein
MAGLAWLGQARHGRAGHGAAGQAWLGSARQGGAVPGKAGNHGGILRGVAFSISRLQQSMNERGFCRESASFTPKFAPVATPGQPEHRQ